MEKPGEGGEKGEVREKRGSGKAGAVEKAATW